MIAIDFARNAPLLGRWMRELVGDPHPLLARPCGDYPHDDIAAARYTWATRIADEYRSVAIFSELLGLVVDLEAPLALSCAIQRLIGDELRHTAVTAQVVEWLGGLEGFTIDLADVSLPPRPTAETAARRALWIAAREIVVAEEESITVLAAYRDAATEPAIRAVLQSLLTDEVRHAAVGRAIVDWLVDSHHPGALDVRDQLATVMATDREHLRHRYLTAASGGPGRALGASLTTSDLPYARGG